MWKYSWCFRHVAVHVTFTLTSEQLAVVWTIFLPPTTSTTTPTISLIISFVPSSFFLNLIFVLLNFYGTEYPPYWMTLDNIFFSRMSSIKLFCWEINSPSASMACWLLNAVNSNSQFFLKIYWKYLEWINENVWFWKIYLKTL